MKILHFEDNDLIAKALQEFLAAYGHQVTRVMNPTLFTGSAEDFDLIITDNDMPTMAGLEFCFNYKGNTPVIMYSGSFDPDLQGKIAALNMTFVEKPGIDQLIAAVEAVATQPKKIVELEITATGGIQMLQDDTLDLCEMGCVETKRASHVEFDNQKQCWFVQSAKTLQILKDGFKSRGDAIAWEKQYYAPGGPGWAELTKEDV